MQCPFCQGEISDSAVRCRHCAKSLYPSSYGQGAASPGGSVASAPPVAGGFKGGPPPAGATPPPVAGGFKGGPPPAGATPPPAAPTAGFAGAPPRAGVGGLPPKDWKPPADGAPTAPASPPPAAPLASPPAAPPRAGFAGGPPKDWKPEGAPEAPAPAVALPRAGFAGGPPKDWKASDAKDEDEPPRRFAGAPPPSAMATPAASPPPSTEGLENTLWAFAQEMPGRRDERMGDETERQQQARHESILDDVRQRAEDVARAVEEMHPEQVLAMAHEAREYIATLPDSDDDEVQAELRKILRVIDKLESAGYRAAGPAEGMVAVKQMSTAAKRGLAVAAVLIALMAWGVVAFLRASDAENAKIPGRLVGVVSLDRGGGTIVRVPFENVRVVSQTDAARALLNKVTGHHDRNQAFKELSTERGSLPAVVETRLSPIGEFVIDNVPPGKYYVIVVTANPKMEDAAGAWMVPVEVQPTKITEFTLSEDNRL